MILINRNFVAGAYVEPTGPLIFISGPISGMPDGNKSAFQRAQGDLTRANFRVENPTVTKGEPGWTWAQYMRASLAQLLLCDGVALLPGWNYSRGACVEKALADELGIEVRLLDDWLIRIDHG